MAREEDREVGIMLSAKEVDDMRVLDDEPRCAECGAEVVWVEKVTEKRHIKKGHPISYSVECDKYFNEASLQCSKDSSHGTGWMLMQTSDGEMVVAPYTIEEGGDTDGRGSVRDDDGGSGGDGSAA